MIIDSLSNPNEVGDEAVLLSNKTQSTVVSSSNRVESTKFCDTSEVDFIIHDDGLQHYSLNRQYEFIIENTNKRDNNFLLPCGPFREPKFFHKNADFILSNYTGSDTLVSIQGSPVYHHPLIKQNMILMIRNFQAVF